MIDRPCCNVSSGLETVIRRRAGVLNGLHRAVRCHLTRTWEAASRVADILNHQQVTTATADKAHLGEPTGTEFPLARQIVLVEHLVVDVRVNVHQTSAGGCREGSAGRPLFTNGKECHCQIKLGTADNWPAIIFKD